MYTLIFSQRAQQDLKSLKKSEPQAYKKARLLIEELAEHPKTGRGTPQLKKYDLEGLYARKIRECNINCVIGVQGRLIVENSPHRVFHGQAANHAGLF